MAEGCASCGHVSRTGARFCTGCGASLPLACPACGEHALPGERFCAGCGAGLTARPARVPTPVPAPRPAVPAEGERKQVTVLFADVAGSMELAERLDPDQLTEVMTGLFEACRRAVEEFGGTVDKFTGDGVMALFGAPVAQEDHARRAGHAALRLIADAVAYAAGLRTTHGVELAIRVGLNSGDVVAGSVGEAFTAVGHTVGLAQRMENVAESGTVCVSEHTAALLGEEFRLEDRGPTVVKGVSAPVRVFVLRGAASASMAGRRRGGSASLVGRDSELAALEAALTSAREGRAQVVGIVGEAGAGKSRLCEELARIATDLGVTVRRTAGVSHAQSVPLLPILGFLRDYFGIAGTDTAAEVRAKIANLFGGFGIDSDAERGLLYDFLEVPDPACPAPQLSPEVRNRRVLDMFRRATARRSEQQTLLLLMEDLHWFDRHSVEFLNAWLPSFPGTRTLVVTNFRPEFHAPWMGSSYYRQIPLSPLDGTAVRTLLDELVGVDPSLTSFAGEMRARTGGNPFFVEEIVRSLAADGTLVGEPGAYRLAVPGATVRVPATVQAVLADRIDRLTSRHKATLQAAAVIGRTFSDLVLAAVTDADADDRADTLGALCSAELLQEYGSEGEYRFWHPLTQEVAYGSLLAAPRRRVHRRVAEALIALGPDRHDELAGVLAGHFEAAGDDLEAARWQLHAAIRTASSDIADARRRLERVVEHLEHVEPGDDPLRLGIRARQFLLRMGSRSGMPAGEGDEISKQANQDARQLGDPALLATVVLGDLAFRLFRGDVAGAYDATLEAMRWADQSGDRDLMAWTYCSKGILHAYLGNYEDGLAVVGVGRALCGGDPVVGVVHSGYSVDDYGCFILAGQCIPAGHLVDAARLLADARARFDTRPVADWKVWTLVLFADLADVGGDADRVAEAEEAAAEAVAVARDTGSLLMGVKSIVAVGLVALLRGRAQECETAMAEALAIVRDHGSGRMDESMILAHRARARLALGDVAAARAFAEEAVPVAQEQGARTLECYAQAVRARVWRETASGPDNLDRAREAADAGAALAAEIGAGTWAAVLAEELARLDGRDDALRACAEGYEAIGATGHAARLRAELS